MGEGGELGPALRGADIGGNLVHHIGDDWPWRPGQNIMLGNEFRGHIGVVVKLSTVNFQTVVIPKRDVEHWGVLERRSIPMAHVYDRSSTIAGTLLFGPIGALVGASMDARAEQKKGGKPVIGVTYRVGDAEHAFFVEFPLAIWYRKAHEYLTACFPGLLRQ